MKILHLVLKGRIPSKKNNKVWTGKYLVSSAKYKKWEANMSEQLVEYANMSC
jgi:hypothetical protein